MPKVLPRLPSGREPIIEINRDTVNVEAMTQVEPDPNWRFVDYGGHVHTWATLGRTCRESTSEYWCEACGDEHTESSWRCLICNVEIEPVYRSAENPACEVPGLWQGTLKLEGKTYHLRGPEIEAFLALPNLRVTDGWLDFVTVRDPEIDASALYELGFREF